MAFVGVSPKIQKIREQIAGLVKSRRPLESVLLLGETGTGKKELAHYIHQQRFPHDGAPLATLDASALHPELLESQLFGHRRGAFTGALEDITGLFEQAPGGTLFIDEIGEIPEPLQCKFLRAIEERRFRPIGAAADLEVRAQCFIYATNRDPQQMLRDGELRRDLWFRISANVIELPPLRQRGEDIVLLAETFLASFADESEPPKALTEGARRLLCTHFWPGNVRQLYHVMEGAFRLSKGNTIHTGDLRRADPDFRDCRSYFECKRNDCKVISVVHGHCWTSEYSCCRNEDGKRLPERLFLCIQCPVLQNHLIQLRDFSPASEEALLWNQIEGLTNIQNTPAFDWQKVEFPTLKKWRTFTTEKAEQKYLKELTAHCGTDTEAMANLAGLSRREIQRLIKRHNLQNKP